MTTSTHEYTTTNVISDFVPTIFSDTLWTEATSTHSGLLKAKVLVEGLQRELKSQRSERAATMPASDYAEWAARQEGFGRMVNRRATDIEVRLLDDPTPALRARVNELWGIIGALVDTIDGNIGDDILERLTVTLTDGNKILLSDAVDDGMFEDVNA